MKEELRFKNAKTWNFRWNLGLVSSTQGRIASRRWLAVKNANQVKCFSSSFKITFEVFIDSVKSAVPIRHRLIYLCKLVNLLSIQRNGFWNRDVHFFHHKKDRQTCLYTSELQDKKNDKNNRGWRLKRIVSQSYYRTFQKRENKSKARQIQVIHFKAALLGLFYH